MKWLVFHLWIHVFSRWSWWVLKGKKRNDLLTKDKFIQGVSINNLNERFLPRASRECWQEGQRKSQGWDRLWGTQSKCSSVSVNKHNHYATPYLCWQNGWHTDVRHRTILSFSSASLWDSAMASCSSSSSFSAASSLLGGICGAEQQEEVKKKTTGRWGEGAILF